jgi:DNA-binding winged helix-turn-helix (wHTH) protein/tetratricopeptide (TPR) repeat protein
MTCTYRFGEFTLTASTRELKRGDEAVAIAPRAFDCLAYLLQHRDRAVGKDELVAAIWERIDVSDTQLGQTVLRARRAVDDDGQTQNVIRTVSRFGYRWVAEVALVDADAPAPPASSAVIAPPQPPPVVEQPVPPPARAARRPRFAALALSALAVLAVVAIVFVLRMFLFETTPDLAALREHTSAVVLPMRVTAQADNSWLRLGVMDLIAERLRAGGLAVPPSESIVALLQGVPGDDQDAVTRAIRRAAPTALIVSGGIVHAGDAWTIDLRAVAPDGTTLTTRSARADALDAARDATDRLLGRLGRAHPPEPPRASGLQERLQRAQAAMLANDLDSARAILVGDPDLAHKESELGYRLSQVDFRAGEYARAETALTSLLAEPEAANDPMFRARVLDGRGAVRIRQDNYADAESDYDDAIALLKDRGNAAELGRALTGRGVSRAMRRDFARALADLGQARVQLAEAGDVLAIARVDADQGALEMNRDRPQDATGYLESAADEFERYSAINELMEALESLASNHMALLQPAEALAASDRSWSLAARVTDANQRLNLIEDRVDAFIALGRFREAGALLSTLPAAVADANPFVARRLPALRARLALMLGDNANAAAQATRALALPAPSDDLGEGVAEIALIDQRATLASAGTRPAGAPAAAWVDFSKPPAYPVQALAEAEWAAYRDDAIEAERLFKHALDMAEARGVPADVGSVTSAFGPWLLAHGALQQAGDVIGRVAPWAAHDYDSALLQVRLFHALGQPDAWARALAQAQSLAGERSVPAELLQPPRSHEDMAAAAAH